MQTEHAELRDSVRRFLEEKSPEDAVRRLMETEDGYDRVVWTQMARQLGLQALIIPEKFGGGGFGHVELSIVMEEMGRVLLCAPFFSTVAMAAGLLLAADDPDAAQDYLPGIADGSTIATVALAEAAGRWDSSGVTLTASEADSSWRLYGEKHYVLDGCLADVVFVVALGCRGVSLFAVDKGAPGFRSTPLPTFDRTRRQAVCTFDGTPARLIGTEGEGWPPVARMLDLAAVALAGEQAGGAEKVLETAVDYAKTRVQFGRAIGSFQAVKHMAADMLLESTSATTAARRAAAAADEGAEDFPVVASLAKAYCSDAYVQVAATSIQLHGGIGFTWEHPAHLYLRRARTDAQLLGDAAYHRELYLRRIGA